MISFDCGSYSRLGIENELSLINFDHHLSNDFYGSVNLVDTDAISTTEVLYNFFVANDVKINGKMALSLYAGLMDDSKCFSSPACSTKTFAIAQRLIELGADHSMCVEWLYRRRSLASLRIKGILLKQMSVVAQGRLAVFDVSLSLLEETGAVEVECKRVLDEALGMRSVQAALMKIERPDGGVKLSLRSDGTLDASRIMAAFGGGGHVHRAGTQLKDENCNELAEKIIVMITKELI
jgi:phosphoesterase RecJ-like protein